MAIPFTQFLRPGGTPRPTEIDMPEEIEELAESFMKAGGWFECEELTTGQVSLTACWKDEEIGSGDIAIEVTPNGPPVVDAVERLIRKAAKYAVEHT